MFSAKIEHVSKCESVPKFYNIPYNLNIGCPSIHCLTSIFLMDSVFFDTSPADRLCIAACPPGSAAGLPGDGGISKNHDTQDKHQDHYLKWGYPQTIPLDIRIFHQPAIGAYSQIYPNILSAQPYCLGKHWQTVKFPALSCFRGASIAARLTRSKAFRNFSSAASRAFACLASVCFLGSMEMDGK